MPKLQQADAFNLKDDDIIFDVDKIELLLNKLPNKYSAGPDGIPITLLKKIFELILFTTLFQKSFNNSDLPDDWKGANVVPASINQYLKAKAINTM